MTFPEFIDEKGVRPLALALGCGESTIYAWKSRGSIPRSRWADLLHNYPKLTYRQLRDMEIDAKARA